MPCLFLQGLYISYVSAFMSFYSHVQPVCHRSITQAWPGEGPVPYCTQNPALSSLGWQWLRPRAMSRQLSKYSDIHSHDRAQALTGDTVVNITPGETMLPGGTYSVGIHPWDSTRPVSLSTLKHLVAMAHDPRVVAIGEAGFDRLRGGDMNCQTSLFYFQAKLADRVGKPLIIHCVRAYDLLLKAAAHMHPTQGMWIVHGFNRNVVLARQLLDAGLDLSMPQTRLNKYAGLPSDRLHTETDAPDTLFENLW